MSLPLNTEDSELTMEQEFALIRYDQQITEIPQEELRTAFLEITRQLMIKDNLIRTLVKAGI